MSKIEPGCLAKIIKSDFSENIGALVRVVQLADPEDFYVGPTPDQLVEWEVIPISRAIRGWAEAFTTTVSWDAHCYGDTDLLRVDDSSDEDPAALLAPLPKQDKVPA